MLGNGAGPPALSTHCMWVDKTT